jgi:sigma-B regulation protein RsbU (phosphoserine phosphatase)
MSNRINVLLSLGALTVLSVGAFVAIVLSGASLTAIFILIPVLILILVLTGMLLRERVRRQGIAARLQTSGERLSFAMQGSDAGLWDWNIEAGDVYYSPRWQTMLGYEPGEVPPTLEFWEEQILHPDDKAVVAEAMEAHVRGETELYEATYRARAKSGDWVWLLGRGKVVERAEDGSPLRMVGTHMDVSERKKIEEQLRQSEERMKFAIEGSDDGVWDYHVDTGETYYNSRWFTMLGYEPGDFEGGSGFFESEVVHPEDLPRFEQGWTDHMEGRTPNYETELRARTKTGEWIWILARGKIVSRDDNNEPTRVVGTHVDIDERKQAETLLRRQSAALDAAADGILITDSDGKILWVNPAFSTLTGYSFEEAVGENPQVLKSDVHDRAFYQHMWQTIGDGHVWSGEIVNKRKDGSLYTEEMSITPVRDDEGEIVNYVAIKRDITERKEMEAELDKARHRMEDELNVGREIQMSMLPLIFPPYPRRGEFDVFAMLEPAREVGGDFYDFFLIDDEHFCLCVGDVSGKGVPAALFMAVTKTLIKSRASNDYSPASILTHVNKEISSNNDASMFVTIFLAILNLNSGKLLYSNAGHNPPYIRRVDGELVRLDHRHGPVIGAVEELVYGQDEGVLERGDLLFTYTDGVTEAMDEGQSLYDERRLASCLSSLESNSAEASVHSVLADVRGFQGEAEQADDITILATAYFGEPEGAEVGILDLVLASRLEEIDRVNSAFNDFAEAENLAVPTRRSINLVLDELLNNAITYAFHDDEEHAIEVRIELSSDRLSVTVSDDGIPFNPFAGPPADTALSVEDREIGGLGIHLVRNVMDEVSYNRRTDRNVVILVKYLDNRSGKLA